MSFDEGILNNSFDSSEYDSYSLTESIDGSIRKKEKKKKKMGLFRHKNRKEEKQKTLEVHDTEIDSQLIHASSEVKSHSTDTNASFESNRNEFHPEIPSTYSLHVLLRSGQYLAARDSNGLSDPYVKFKVDGETVYKSKCCKETLDPKWDESFDILLHLKSKVTLRVYDRDRGRRDDFMGGGEINLASLEETLTDVSIHLEDADCDEELGYIHLQLKLVSLNKQDSKVPDKIESTSDSIPMLPDKGKAPLLSHKGSLKQRRRGSGRSNSNHPVAIATIQLVSGSNLSACDTNGFSDPFVRLNLGKQKGKKSKVCHKTLNPVWKEEFTFHLSSADPSVLELGVWDYDVYRKDDFLGRCEVDLWALAREETHSLTLDLVDTSGSILLLVTVHALEPDDKLLTSYDLSILRDRYGLKSTLENLTDVGFAEICIVSASGLKSADINGKSDPFCVVQLCNSRAQTHTCEKTLDPVWNRTFTFQIRDINDTFDIWIFDEDQNCEKEFLGRIDVPILRSRNGEEKTYALKDNKLKDRAKGTISIRINYIFNPVRAAVRTFSPREEIFMEKIVKWKKSLLLQNFHRVWSIVQQILAAADFLNSCFTWENKLRSAIAFLMFLVIVWNFELYMVPVVLLMLLGKNYFDIFIKKTRQPRHLTGMDDVQRSGADDDDDEDDKHSTSIIQKLRAVEEVLSKVQNILDTMASFGERVYNTFTWSVPYLGHLLVIVLCAVSIILYFIPLRTIVLLWGINKFTKRIRKPNFIPNNEVMDYLSRIPSNIQLDEYRELPLDSLSPKSNKKKR